MKYSGIGTSAFFLIILVGSSISFILEDTNGHNTRFITIFVTTSIMLLVCVYTLLTYYIERLVLSGERIAFRSVFQKIEFDASDLEAVQWKPLPAGGNIAFKVSGTKARIHLGGYDKKDRLQIIRAIHKLAPAEVQFGWPLFCHLVSLPLRDGKPSFVRTMPSSALVRVTRKRYDGMALIFIPITLALSMAAWLTFNHAEGFLIPFMLIICWLPLRFSVPPEGEDQVPIKFTRPGRDQLITFAVCAALFGAFLAFTFGLPFFGIKESIACAIGSVPGIAAILVMLYAAHKLDKQRGLVDEQATDLALSEWEQGEIAVPLPDSS